MTTRRTRPWAAKEPPTLGSGEHLGEIPSARRPGQFGAYRAARLRALPLGLGGVLVGAPPSPINERRVRHERNTDD